MIQQPSTIVRTVVNLLVPFIQLFALYAIVHGHYGAGGGFQGGALLAVSIVLSRISNGAESLERFSSTRATVIAAGGMLLFGLVGIVPMFFGASFLDYEGLPLFWVHGAELRYLGILIIEVGIALAVFGTLVLIYDSLAGDKW